MSQCWYEVHRRLALLLQQAGCDAIHMLDLSLGNRTPDQIINQLSVKEQRVVVTKDADFVNSFVLRQEPWKASTFLTSLRSIK